MTGMDRDLSRYSPIPLDWDYHYTVPTSRGFQLFIKSPHSKEMVQVQHERREDNIHDDVYRVVYVWSIPVWILYDPEWHMIPHTFPYIMVLLDMSWLLTLVTPSLSLENIIHQVHQSSLQYSQLHNTGAETSLNDRIFRYPDNARYL